MVSFQLCKNLLLTVLFMYSVNEFDCGFVNVGSKCLSWVVGCVAGRGFNSLDSNTSTAGHGIDCRHSNKLVLQSCRPRPPQPIFSSATICAHSYAPWHSVSNKPLPPITIGASFQCAPSVAKASGYGWCSQQCSTGWSIPATRRFASDTDQQLLSST